VRIGENHSYLPQSSIRSAVPVRARDILKPTSDSAGSDSVSGAALVHADNREARIEELRKSVQSGDYQVDAEELSAKIIDRHLDK
jgi:anti-sigma28 factor (negative regulator of flagellin synthesis)